MIGCFARIDHYRCPEIGLSGNGEPPRGTLKLISEILHCNSEFFPTERCAIRSESAIRDLRSALCVSRVTDITPF